MNSFANQICRRLSCTIAALLGLFACLPTPPCAAQQTSDATEAAPAPLPFDVFGQPINNELIYFYLEKNASKQKGKQAPDAVETLLAQLKSAPQSSDVELDSITTKRLSDTNDLYSHMVKSTLFFGQFYDCGKCDRSHVSMASAVVISESGLVLTNYHVLTTTPKGEAEGFMGMTYDGKCFEVEKVLAADRVADIVLLQLKADGHKFHAAPIAKERPTPMTKVRVVSHPSGNFFILTTGEVSRYSTTIKVNPKTKQRMDSRWMEITADFGGGSSGAGVFNAAGEVVGVVSRIRPLTRAGSTVTIKGKEISKPSLVEMFVRRCVDLDAIQTRFASADSTPEANPIAALDSRSDADSLGTDSLGTDSLGTDSLGTKASTIAEVAE